MRQTLSKSLRELVELVNGELINTSDSQITVSGVCPFSEQRAGELTFLTRMRQAQQLVKLTASAIVLPSEALAFRESITAPAIVVPHPQRAIIDIVHALYPPLEQLEQIHPTAIVHETAEIGTNVAIGPYCVVGKGCVIGNNSLLHPHVVLYEGVKLGENVIIHAGANVREFCELGSGSVVQNGAVIGSDGFGYVPDKERGIIAVPQIGTVRSAEGVDIGANSCIDRATYGTTDISALTKIDNLVQVGHNVKIGTASILCAQVGIAGSCEIGNGVTLGGQTGVSDHMRIADGVRTAGKTGVTQHLTEKGDYAGYPCFPINSWRRQMANLKKLPETLKKLRQIKNPGEK